MEFLTLALAVLVGNILADVLTATYVVLRSRAARKEYESRMTEWQATLDAAQTEAPEVPVGGGYA